MRGLGVHDGGAVDHDGSVWVWRRVVSAVGVADAHGCRPGHGDCCRVSGVACWIERCPPSRAARSVQVRASRQARSQSRPVSSVSARRRRRSSPKMCTFLLQQRHAAFCDVEPGAQPQSARPAGGTRIVDIPPHPASGSVGFRCSGWAANIAVGSMTSSRSGSRRITCQARSSVELSSRASSGRWLTSSRANASSRSR